MSIDPKKFDAISKMDALQSKRDLESFKGIVNYLNHYSSKLTQLAEPLN